MDNRIQAIDSAVRNHDGSWAAAAVAFDAGVAAERERRAPEIERLRNAIERLGSMEAFSIPRSIRPGVDDELIARIDYARSILEVGPAGHAAAVAKERERWSKAATAALEVLDDLPEWSNAGHACQLLREALGPNVGANRIDPVRRGNSG